MKTATQSATFVSTSQPWGLYHRNGHRVLCSDGIIRAVEMGQTADTFFSVPARLRLNGKWITGYVTTEESGDGGRVYCFRQHDGHGSTLPDWPETYTPEMEALLNPPPAGPSLESLISAVASADKCDAFAAIQALPYDALGDDYRSNPEAACRKALQLTRGISRPSRRLRAIDRLLGMHGVETVRTRSGEWGFSYANTGHSYACTVVLFASGKFRVSDVGTIVERDNSRRYA